MAKETKNLDAFEEIGSQESRAPFFKFTDVSDGGIITVTLLENPRDKTEFESTYSAWEALCDVNGREVIFAVGNKSLALWLAKQNLNDGDTVVLRCTGTGLDRRWAGRRETADKRLG